jgi:hypothetical protein
MKKLVYPLLSLLPSIILVQMLITISLSAAFGSNPGSNLTPFSGLNLQNRSGGYYLIGSVYTDPALVNGSVINLIGYYTNPELNLLLEDYGDLFSNKAFPQYSLVSLSGVEPPSNAHNGGLVIVNGTVNFIPNPEPYHPGDSILVEFDVISVVEVILEGVVDDDLNFNNFHDGQNNSVISSREDCDECKFAILISGGINHRNNHSRYWSSLVALHNHKVDNENYCKHNIFTHYYHGTDSIPAGGAGIFDSVRVASRDDISDSFDEISRRIAECHRNGKQSTFQKLVFNHGKPSGAINLLGQDTLRVADLRQMQQKIIDSCATTMYDEFLQCYGGHAVDEMKNLETRNKATIYANSSADKACSWSPRTGVDRYLSAKIASLAAGNSYPDAVVAAKLAYDQFLQNAINNEAARLAQINARINDAIINGDFDLADSLIVVQQRSINLINTWNAAICKSRNVTIAPMKEYCEWKRYVVPPGGQIVIEFKGSRKGCGNVTVYREDPVTGQRVKVRVWNWNLPGSLRYVTGNNQRVINGDESNSTAFWIHNDNGEFTITVSANGNQNLPQSISNVFEYPGFSSGGRDGSAGEFSEIPFPEYFVESIDQIPFPLQQLPAIMGGEFVQSFGCSFNIITTDPLWTQMRLQIDVAEVLMPGVLDVFTENSPTGFATLLIDEPGTYIVSLGDMTSAGPDGLLFFAVPFSEGRSGAMFSFDSWGLTTEFDTDLELENITIVSGEDICYEALGYITTGGNGTTFSVQNGAVTDLVAGQGILMLDGTTIAEGAQFRAYISTDGIFCSPPAELMSEESELGVADEIAEAVQQENSFFNVFPNPTHGQFILEFKNAGEASTIVAEIYSILGERILKQELPAMQQYQFDLSDQQPGIYFIRVMNGYEIGVEKIIKQ